MANWTGGMGAPLEFASEAHEKEAIARAEFYRAVDPFPSVPRALLSSAEIRDYIRVTAMVDKFEEGSLKSASYEVFVGGEFIYWDGKKKVKKKIDRKKDFHLRLPENSISFIQVEPYFRLPDYIAMRFNLRISHVHRGLLLGTGPLVDPGFHGKLLIPIHNLTSTEYLLDTDKALIWIEFTKTTAHFNGFGDEERKLHRNESRSDDKENVRGFVPFPPDKSNISPDLYLFKANGGRPIVSSIPDALLTANQDAKLAKESAENLQKWARGIGVLAVLGALIGITAAVSNAWSIVQTSNAAIYAANQTLTELKNNLQLKLAVAADRAASASRAAKEATDKLERSNLQVEELKKQMEQFQTSSLKEVRQLQDDVSVLKIAPSVRATNPQPKRRRRRAAAIPPR